MGWGESLVLIMFLAVFRGPDGTLAVSGIYVNNQKIDKFEADRIKLLHPARPSPSINQQPSSSVGKNELLTKDNFTNAQHYYQYLVGANPSSYIDLLWGRNKTHFPSLLRVGAPSLGFNWHSDDEQSSIKNTLNNSSPVYIGDYQRVQLPVLLPSTSTRAPTLRPSKRFKKRPKPKPTPAPHPVQVSPGGKNELSPETLALLSRYYSFSCTLVPKQRSQLVATTTMPPTTTRKLKTRRLTTQRPTTVMTTSRPTTSSSTGKRKKTTVYVDPPVINRIGGMLESVYNFMENALTSTEYVPDSKETGAAGVSKADPQDQLRSPTAAGMKVKRNTRNITSAISEILTRIGGSTELDSDIRSTSSWLTTTTESSSESSKRFTPDRVTISGLPTIVSEGNKNKMTTNIQVTSEYTAATPPTVPVRKPSSSSDENDEDSSEEESEEDYFGGFDGFSEDDEEEDDDEDDDDQSKDGDSEELSRPGGQGILVNDKDYDDDDEGGAQAGQPVRIKRVKKRRRKKRPAASYEDTAEYSDEDDGSSDEEGEYDDRDEPSGDDDEEDDDDYESGEAPDDAAEGFFGGLFSTFGRFVRSLGFGGAARGTPEEYDDYDESGGRSTTPRILDTNRRPTRSTSNGADGPATQIERDPDVTSPERSPPSWLNLPPSYLFNEIGDDAGEVPVQEELTVLEAPVPPTPESPTSVGTSSSWFDLMMPWDFFNPWTHDDAENPVQEAILATEAPVTPAAPTRPPEVETSTASPPVAGSNWLSQFFAGSPTPTKTPKPRPKPSKAPQAEQLVAALAQYLVHARPTPPSTPKPKRKKSYAGYQLWRVSVQGSEHLQRLVDFQRSPEGLQLQWWSGPSLYEPTDVLVPPGAVAENFHDYLLEDGVQYEPTIRDLGRAIAYENPRMTRREQIENEVLYGHPMTWFRYHRYADIVKYLDYLGRRHSQQVRLLHIGRSYEGRPLTVVRISFAPPTRRSSRSVTKKRRPAVFIQAGAHGHQWIGPAVATWLLQRLLEPYNSTAEQETIRAYDWYVLPVANPDGYEYSHEHDRMWSKSRSRPDHRPQPGFGQTLLTSALSWWSNVQTTTSQDRAPETCYGVDLDHNWAHRWQDTAESSRSECSANYAGPTAFSEPETRAVRDLLLTGRARNVRIFLSLQAYGQTLSYPSDGDNSSTRHGAYAFGDVHEMAAVGLEAMRGAGGELPYTLERPSSANRGPERGGTATGYARYAAGIRYSYTLRLPDTGTHGFLFPPSNIISTGRDTFELIKGMMDYS